MSIVVTQRCAAMTGKRWAKEPRRCKHDTSRGIYCWQHLKEKEGLRVKKSTVPGAGLGLFVTKPRKKGERITEYSGKRVVSRDPNYGGPYVLETSNYHFIDASKTNVDGLGRYINHQPERKANTKFVVHRGKANMDTTKAVKKDKELFVPYGEEYFKHFPFKAKKGFKKVNLPKLRKQIRAKRKVA